MGKGSLENFKDIGEKKDKKKAKGESLYPLLDRLRGEKFERAYKETTQYIDDLYKEHNELVRIFRQQREQKREKFIPLLLNHLCKNNMGPPFESAQTLILMDATGSMGDWLRAAQRCVKEMFKEITDTLETLGKSAFFSVQVAFYLNYNAQAADLLEISPWTSNSVELQRYMAKIAPEYGMGNEAIEVGLAHVLKEHAKDPISQVLLIGDAPPNTKKEVQKNRRCHGESYWQHTAFDTPIYYEDLLKKIVKYKIPIHTFYIHNRAKAAFASIAEKTKGKTEALDINKGGGKQLKEAIAIEIVGQMGGKEAISTYKKKFASFYK